MTCSSPRRSGCKVGWWRAHLLADVRSRGDNQTVGLERDELMNCRLPSIVCGVLFAIIAAEYVSAQYPAHIAVLGRAEIAGLRVHAADGPSQRLWDKGQQHLPGDEAWLIGEHRTSGEKKYYLANLPAGANLRTLAATIKARWICEQAHQQLKEELGLDHFEGRSWRGLHRHALMTMIAYAFLQHRRLIKARREKKNQRTTASTKLASRAPRHRRPHHSAASVMPALPKMDRCQTAA